MLRPPNSAEACRRDCPHKLSVFRLSAIVIGLPSESLYGGESADTVTKMNKDIAPQSRDILQTFVRWGRGQWCRRTKSEILRPIGQCCHSFSRELELIVSFTRFDFGE